MPFKRTEKQKEATAIISSSLFSMLYGGSRSGKTFILVRSIIIRALKCKSRHLIVRHNFNHAKASIGLDTMPSVLKLCFPKIKFKLNKQDWFWTFENGSEIWLAGIGDEQRSEKILGNEYSTIYCNESSQISYEAVCKLVTRLAQKNVLRMRFFCDCNPPSKKHWSYRMFVEFKNQDGESLVPEDYPSLLMNPLDNESNINSEYIQSLRSLPKKQRDRFLLGKFMSDLEGALWSETDIANARSKEHGELKRIIIAVDPAVSNNKSSDLTGIIVIGMDHAGVGVVLEDASLKASPTTWAKKIIKLYHKYEANYVFAEINEGGDLVESIIRSIDSNIKYKSVRASKGKFARAEPIQSLYERGLMSHDGSNLEDLEEELLEWIPDKTTKSPDRLDALVWGAFSLGLHKSKSRYCF